MATSREARYICGNDIGKTVSYSIPKDQYEPEGEQLLLGGVLESFGVESYAIDDTKFMDSQPRIVYQVSTVVLNISGNIVRLAHNKIVTLYGQDSGL